MFEPSAAFTDAFMRQSSESIWSCISPLYSVDEESYLKKLSVVAKPEITEGEKIKSYTRHLIEQVRNHAEGISKIDALLAEYSLDTQQGVLLMCLAEALIRIPDKATANALIKDKLTVADWGAHLNEDNSVFVNAATWGLLLSGKVMSWDVPANTQPVSVIKRLVNSCGEPVIRSVMNQVMKVMGKHFVLGENITSALKNTQQYSSLGYTFSFDMLGEAAITLSDAKRYFDDYKNAILKIGAHIKQDKPQQKPSLSIKLSALHPRFEATQEERVVDELYTSTLKLLEVAKHHDVGITIDAEEADRFELGLKLFAKLFAHPLCRGWGKFGLVIQAYSKRALPALCWLVALGREQGDIIPIRLVKGAYWDTEIKHCQQLGTSGYPVFTRKEGTDISYLTCAKFLLQKEAQSWLYPQFATHNAQTVANITTLTEGDKQFEFQRLHGMGGALYNKVLEEQPVTVRIYAPVGHYQDLLPYLVRRLLENGANSSFVHRLYDAQCPISELSKHPTESIQKHHKIYNTAIPLPRNLFGTVRKNSQGTNITIASQWLPLREKVQSFLNTKWRGASLINGKPQTTADTKTIYCPYDNQQAIGEISLCTREHVEQAFAHCQKALPSWQATTVDTRARCLEKLADLLEYHNSELIALCHLEAGKTIQDSIDEIREAVDFCRYYAQMARHELVPHGEETIGYKSCGIFVCISPWNFPLAIFIGQISAALVTGNCVIAKPAGQTSLIATKAVELVLEAGVPKNVVALLIGRGSTIGQLLTQDVRSSGVVFTGSTEVAKFIQQSLAQRDAPPCPLIAETGGQNAMIVDSTALPEQVVTDIIQSAFTSAGQRCSALRVVYIQEDIAERIITLLKGAMQELKLGDPSDHKTDIGPVIDKNSQKELISHIKNMTKKAQLLAQSKLPKNKVNGFFVAPTLFEIKTISVIEKENFGPILHLIRYKAHDLDQVIEEINSTGFGLTLGIHSRNESTYRYIAKHVRAGNIYVNRNQIGASVGVQPFGGLGLSGTGPKAGGPHYLQAFCEETSLHEKAQITTG